MNIALESSINGINTAISAVNSAFKMSKIFVFNITGGANIETGDDTDDQDDTVQAGSGIFDALYNTTGIIQATGNGILENLINSKLQLQEALTEFNSQSAFQNVNSNINIGINATFDGVENAGNYLGVFGALDNIIQGSVAVPFKLKNILAKNAE